MTTKTNIPTLRFPEFEGDWVEKKLGEVTDRIGDGLHGTPIYSREGSYFFINGNNISNGKVVLFPETKTVSADEYNKHKVELSNCTLLLSINGTIGNVAKYRGEKICLGKSVAYLNIGVGTWLDFVYYHLQLKTTKRFFEVNLTGTTIKNLSLGTIRSTPFHFPALPEQQKIAAFLSAVDARIQALQRKKELLQAYKKGLMQQLFAQTLRFKDAQGRDFPDWEEKRLGEVLDYEQPTSYLVTNTEYNDKYSTPVVTAGKTFILGYTDEDFGIYSKGLPVIIFDDFTTASQFVDFPFKAKSSAMKILTSKNGADIRFMFEALQMITYEIGGHGRHWISVFSDMEVSIPSLPEQQKIAAFLGSLDAAIGQVQAQVVQTQRWKQGLLQQLFV